MDTASKLARLKSLIEERAILKGEFTLTSGLKSAYYFDAKSITYHPEAIALLSDLLGEIVAEVDCVGGLESGANPLVTAAQIGAFRRGRRVKGFFVRRQQKSHGTGRLIDGIAPEPGDRVAVVDDTLTTGGSILQAVAALDGSGCKIDRAVVIVDRRQGGTETLAAKGYRVLALLQADASGNLSPGGAFSGAGAP